MGYRVAVVGSGPSGTTAAQVLIEAGIEVDMIDVGTDARSGAPEAQVQKKEGLIPRKTLFGSSYMYRRRDGLNIQASDNVSFDTSHAKGGLSSVWGATVGPATARDIADWPVSIDTLSAHLRKVFDGMRLSAREDQIDAIYPIKLDAIDLPYENRQSRHILERVGRHAAQLQDNGIYVGKAKLAIEADPQSPRACILCGQCMTGCARGSIFTAWNTVEALQIRPNFRYLEGRLVKRFKEDGDGVELTMADLQGNAQEQVRYDAVMLAAGCIDSTRIVDASLGWTGHEYHILDSQKFYFPVLVGRGGNSPIDKSISLAHLYVQGFDSNQNVIQGQLYPGKLIANTILEHLAGRLGKLAARLMSPFLNRCFVGVAYFSSAVSGRMGIRFTNDNQLIVNGQDNDQSVQEVDHFLARLSRLRRKTGFTPVFNLKLRSKLGHSQHFGGTIPMKSEPGKYEADSVGRPFGCESVFVVDSTVLTSIPATPTTGLAMANASRIATFLVQRVRNAGR